MPDNHPPPPSSHSETLLRQNLRAETTFSAFNGIYLGLAVFAAPVVAVIGVGASPLEVTVLASAYPVGAFLGPLWAHLGRRAGMQTLVITAAVVGSVPLLFLFWVKSSVLFTALLTISQMMVSVMRMGQSSLYGLTYPYRQRGRVLGRLTFWTYLTMVPAVLATGWLLDGDRYAYQFLYPLAGVSGLVGCLFYARVRTPPVEARPAAPAGLRRSVGNFRRILRQDRLYFLFQAAFFTTGGAVFMSQAVVLLLAERRMSFSAFELALCLTVIPRVVLIFSSPGWGRVLDRVGIIRARLLISLLLSGALASYYVGLVACWPPLLYLGSVLFGLSTAGGELTWFLASSLLAPRDEDVPAYNGIHFVLNGTRGLILPWAGFALLVLTGTGSVLGATLFSLAGLPFLYRALRLNDSRLGAARAPAEARAAPGPARCAPPAAPQPVRVTSPAS